MEKKKLYKTKTNFLHSIAYIALSVMAEIVNVMENR